MRNQNTPGEELICYLPGGSCTQSVSNYVLGRSKVSLLVYLMINILYISRPVFRSYRPLDEELKKSSVPLAEPEEVDQHITNELGKAADPPVMEEIVRQI